MEKQVMDFNVIIEQDEDEIYVARVPEIEGCYTQGKTLQEVLERIKEAIEVCLEADGYSLDDKRTFIDGIGDVNDILEHFKNREKENPIDRRKKYFFVPTKEIKDKSWDLSISKYREVEYEEIEYEKPSVIKKKIIQLEEEILKGLKDLEI